MPLTDRFLSFVNKTDSCWLWTGAKDGDSYGMFWLDGKTVHASRVSYLIYVGEIGKGLQVCHSCDNPSCVRPEHLFIGTARDNARDREMKGRGAAQKRKGEMNPCHKLTSEEVKKIRNLYENGQTQAILSVEFSVNQSEISRIVNNKRYAVEF